MITTTFNGKTFNVDANLLKTATEIASCRGGGTISVKGYVPTSGYEVSPLVDYIGLSRFSTRNLYQRKIDALNKVQFEDLPMRDEKLREKDEDFLRDLFAKRKQIMIDKLQGSLDGVRDTAYHRAHDTFYVQVAQGVKFHLKTIKTKEGTELVLGENGLPTADTIMVSFLEIGKTIRKEGVFKTVNSRLPTRMQNEIKSVLNSRSVGLKKLSLKEGNFETIKMDKQEFTPESIMGSVRATVTVEELQTILDMEESVEV